MSFTQLRRVLAVACVAAAATLSAGSLDTLSNQSASYFFSTAQTASTAGAGIIPYNPAGTALLEKGFYLDASSQTIFKFYSETDDSALLNDTYKQNEPTPSLPSLNFAYNFGEVGPGKLAVYANGGIPAGGGGLNWKDGTIATNVLKTYLSGTSFKASSIYYGVGGGISYAFLDNKVSASAGARYVMAQRSGTIKGTATAALSGYGITGTQTLDFEYTAQGVTPIFGLDIRPIDRLTLGFRYEMETPLEFEYDVNKIDPFYSAVLKLNGLDGLKVQENLPQVFSFAAEYQFTPEFTLSTGTNLYFLGAADLDGTEDYFGVGYELNLAAQYQLTKKLLVGGTFMYSEQSTKDSYFEEDNELMTLLAASGNPPLDSLTFGTGAKYNIWKSLDLLLTGAYIHYLPVEATTDKYKLDVTYNKDIVEICLGASYKF